VVGEDRALVELCGRHEVWGPGFDTVERAAAARGGEGGAGRFCGGGFTGGERRERGEGKCGAGAGGE